MNIDLNWLPHQAPIIDFKATLHPSKEIASRWFNFPPYHDEPKLWHLSAVVVPAQVKPSKDIKDENSQEAAGGSSLEFDRALAKLAGETVERYTISKNVNLNLGDLQSWQELVQQNLCALDPFQLVIGDEYPHKSRRNEKILWIQGFNLNLQIPALIPAQLVFVPHIFRDNEAVWRSPISTGAAAHSTLEGALYGGLCEVVERDAFQIAWLRQLRLNRINLTPGDTYFCNLLNQLIEAGERYNLHCELYQLPCSLPLSVCMAVIWDDTGIGPRCSLGAKCSQSSLTACVGALEEAYQMRSWLRYTLDKSGAFSKNKPLDTLLDRSRHWLTDEASEVLKNWTQQFNCSISLSEMPSELSLGELVESVIQDGGTPYFVDLTANSPECLRQLGWHITKVIIPEYQPLNLTESMEDFALPRIDNASQRLNVEALIPAGQKFRYPHPFL